MNALEKLEHPTRDIDAVLISAHRLRQLSSNLPCWIQRGSRILRHVADARAPQLHQPRLIERQHILAVDKDASRNASTVRTERAQRGLQGRRFPDPDSPTRATIS